jgi:hypothetical protein
MFQLKFFEILSTQLTGNLEFLNISTRAQFFSPKM